MNIRTALCWAALYVAARRLRHVSGMDQQQTMDSLQCCWRVAQSRICLLSSAHPGQTASSSSNCNFDPAKFKHCWLHQEHTPQTGSTLMAVVCLGHCMAIRLARQLLDVLACSRGNSFCSSMYASTSVGSIEQEQQCFCGQHNFHRDCCVKHSPNGSSPLNTIRVSLQNFVSLGATQGRVCFGFR